VEGKPPWYNVKHPLGICLEGLNKTTQILTQGSGSSDIDLNPDPAKSKSRVVITLTQSSVIYKSFIHETYEIKIIYLMMLRGILIVPLREFSPQINGCRQNDIRKIVKIIWIKYPPIRFLIGNLQRILL
jgi:hypothetical protein